MKRLWILGLTVLALSLTACEKEKSATPDSATTTAREATGEKFTVVMPDQLPDLIKTYIQNQYAGATINHAGKGPKGNYGLLIEQNGVEKVLLFKTDGTFKFEHDLKIKSVDASALPTLASRYIQKNYSGATVKRVFQRPKGNYGVLVQTGNEYQLLAFTRNGLFLKELTGAKAGKEIDTSALPTSITSYITSHYASATIKKAGQGPKGKYGVVIETVSKRKIIIFDETGSFLRELGR